MKSNKCPACGNSSFSFWKLRKAKIGSPIDCEICQQKLEKYQYSPTIGTTLGAACIGLSVYVLIIWGALGFLALVTICLGTYLITSYHDAYLFNLRIAGELARRTQIKINLVAFFAVLFVSLAILYYLSVLSYEITHASNTLKIKVSS